MIIGGLLLIACFIFLGVLLIRDQSNHKQNEAAENFSLEEISVIIPYKNEAQHLPQLLESLSKQKQLPSAIYFVNDHSTDISAAIVDTWCAQNPKGVSIHLDHELNGKKAALRRAIYELSTEYFLTLDADVQLSENYFSVLTQVKKAKLVILPVLMNATSTLSRFFSLEYHYFNAFNFLVSNYYTLSASGANLLVEKTSFLAVDSYHTHKHLCSGDDYFLLRDFQQHKLSHYVSNNFNVSATTNSVTHWKDYLKQRIRWFKKTEGLKNREETILGVFILTYFLSVLPLILLLISGNLILFSVLILGLQSYLAHRIFTHYEIPPLAQPNGLEFLVFHILYPFVLLTILIRSIFEKESWK